MLRRLLLYVLCGLVVGCYDTVYFDGEEAKVLVLNAVLVEGCDSVEVMLTETKAAYDTSAWRIFPEAEVRLYEDGKEVGQGEWRPDGRFVVSVRVKEKCTYRVEAVVPGKGMVWGETTVPERLEECRMEVWYERKEYGSPMGTMICKWKDTPLRRNYYWFGAQKVQKSEKDTLCWDSYLSLECESSLPDPFNRVLQIGEGNQGNKVLYDEYIRVEDTGREGEEMELCYKTEVTPFKLMSFAMSVDVHWDAYLKSLIENYYNARQWGDEIPWVFHSAYVYTNIRGGTGLVASYSPEAVVLRLEKDTVGLFGPGVPVKM